MSSIEEQITQIRNGLKEAKNLGMPIQADLYSHLTEVMNRIMLHHPRDAFERFETISRIVKETNFDVTPSKPDSEINSRAGEVANSKMLETLAKWKKTINVESGSFTSHQC